MSAVVYSPFLSPTVRDEYEDDAINRIADEIWNDDTLLLAAVRAASDSRQSIGTAVSLYAVFLYDTKRGE